MGFMSAVRSALDKIMPGRQPGGAMYGTYARSDAGIDVSEEAAMRLAAVQACVRVLSEDIAALPLQVFMRTKDGGKERARSHPLYFLLHDEPNGEMTAMSFKQAMMVNLLLGGNAYAFVEYDMSGARDRALAAHAHRRNAIPGYQRAGAVPCAGRESLAV